MRKSYFLAAAAVVAMVGCTNEDYFGVTENAKSGEVAINFGSVGKTVTRADKVGADAAALLDNNFVVYGAKYVTSYVNVFDNYSVNFAGDAGSTESNSAGWEYVGQVLATNPAPAAATTQTIKYWDYAALQYDFVAFSQGKGVDDGSGTKTYATFTQADLANLGSATNPVYTVSGTVEELGEAYVADLVTAYNPNDFQKTVTPLFRNLGAKIRIAIYETIPGYSVRNVTFYPDASTATAATAPTLFADDATLPAGEGKMNVYFPVVTATKGTKPSTLPEGYNKAVIEFEGSSTSDATSTVEFAALQYSAPEKDETTTSDVFLGRTSNTATYAGVKDAADATAAYKKVIPSGTGNKLNLRVDYVLESINGDGETITVTGATAVVPAIYTNWQPNYAYTYIFKISDQTNGQTGTGTTPAGLYPITFDAVVSGDVDGGIQETITEVGDPAITTYQKGKVVTENDEYFASDPIYAVVNDCATPLVVGSENANEHVQLFTATVQPGAIQTITEASVANCFTNGTVSGNTYTVTDANSKTLTLTKVASGFTVENTIPATDAPHGVTITKTSAIAKIASPAAATVYAFQYKTAIAEYTAAEASTLKAGEKYYTMDKSGFLKQFTAVGNENFKDNEYYTAVATSVGETGTHLVSGTIYYTSANATGGFVANGSEVTTADDQYYTMTATKVTTGTTMAVGTTYYKYNATTGVPTETKSGDGTTAVTGYYTLKTPAKYAYKVIRVK